MKELTADWPDDADGGVFRRLAEHHFDFSKPHTIDYNIDFLEWPPTRQALELLESMYGPVTVYEPDEHGDGYAQFQMRELVTYEKVVSVQRSASNAMRPFGGVCESWGVMQDAP